VPLLRKRRADLSEVHSDRRVTFAFEVPTSKKLPFRSRARPSLSRCQKDDQGVWSVTTEALAPDYYGYTIIADGVGLFDPSNHAVKPNFLYRASELHVPDRHHFPGDWRGAAWRDSSSFLQVRRCGDDRDFFVYTPPGYDRAGSKRTRYSICCHGFSDDSSAWTAVGRANVILDNLIAQGKANPMIVAMPLVTGRRRFFFPTRGCGAIAPSRIATLINSARLCSLK